MIDRVSLHSLGGEYYDREGHRLRADRGAAGSLEGRSHLRLARDGTASLAPGHRMMSYEVNTSAAIRSGRLKNFKWMAVSCFPRVLAAQSERNNGTLPGQTPGLTVRSHPRGG